MQVKENLQTNGKQADGTKTVPRTEEKECSNSRKREKMVRKVAPAPPSGRELAVRGERPTSPAPFFLIGHMLAGLSLLASEHKYNHFLIIIMFSLITQRLHLDISFLKAEVMPLFFI